MKQSQQQKKRAARRKQQRKNILLYTLIGFVLVAMIVGAVLTVSQPASSQGLMGVEVPIVSAEHILTGTPPGPYNSNPPAGGVHYEPDFEPGFYEESDLAGLPSNPEGYLVHNLEHGYVIFWYNCQAAGVDCASLKQAIRTVMDEAGKPKLIAFPWTAMEEPLALTSWGRILKITRLDSDQMLEFIRRNYNQAPEPNMS